MLHVTRTRRDRRLSFSGVGDVSVLANEALQAQSVSGVSFYTMHIAIGFSYTVYFTCLFNLNRSSIIVHCLTLRPLTHCRPQTSNKHARRPEEGVGDKVWE